MVGLGQVMSKQPEVLRESFPGPHWDFELFKAFAFDFGWVVPICHVDYLKRYLLNVVAFPLTLGLLVALTSKRHELNPSGSNVHMILPAEAK